jgi:hypothetical protein
MIICALVKILAEKKAPPVVQGSIGGKDFKSDTNAFVQIKKNANEAATSKDEK